MLKNILSYIFLLRRRLYEFIGNPRYSRPALGGLDRKLEKYLNTSNGFFIEIGGNDGFTQSNTYYLEIFLNWKGVLVEGIPELFGKCRKLRRRSKVYNCAAVAEEYQQSHVEMHFANLMSVVDGSLQDAEKQKRHLEEGRTVQNISNGYTLKIPARTLNSILDEACAPEIIDFFSLDVEGYELNVLKGLDLNRYKPRFILIEARNFDEINSYLSSLYIFTEQLSVHDYLFTRKS